MRTDLVLWAAVFVLGAVLVAGAPALDSPAELAALAERLPGGDPMQEQEDDIDEEEPGPGVWSVLHPAITRKGRTQQFSNDGKKGDVLWPGKRRPLEKRFVFFECPTGTAKCHHGGSGPAITYRTSGLPICTCACPVGYLQPHCERDPK